jgi:type IV secretory pathway TraG/TraD family ATPase VirD4
MATGLGGYYGIGTDLFPIGVLALTIAWHRRRDPDGKDHLRGLRMLTPRQHNRQLNGSWLRRTYQKLTPETPGIKLGSVTLPRKLETEHIVILGNTGSGKSTTQRQILYQVQERREPTIIFDPDREYVQEFYNEARGDIILNAVDVRCPFWTPWFELRDLFRPIDAAALAASIIRGRPQNDTQDYFQRNARALVRGMFEAIPVKDRDNLEVFADFLKQTRDQLRAQLERTKAPAAIIDPGAHDSGGGTGIIGVTDSAIEGFGYMPRRDQTERRWSAREWAADPRGWIFLTSDSTIKDAVQALQGIWLDCLVRWLMARSSFKAQHVWLFMDECPAMGYQPQLLELATRGRKRNLSLVMCAQSVSQLRQIYSHDGAVTLISAPSTKVVLRVDESEMAEWASQQLGVREVERLQMTQLAGLSQLREGVNLQPQRTIERLILADEIKLLPPLHGYLCIAGHDRTSITIPERHLEARQPALIARTYDSDAAKVAPAASNAPKKKWATL